MAFCENAGFPSTVLQHRYPNTPNLHDVITLAARLRSGEDVAGLLSNPPDIVVGGSPCQSYSIAGARQGLSDSRGQLTLTYAEIIHVIKPKILIWENVPGVLSDKSNAFGTLLGDLAGHGDALSLPPGHKRWPDAGVVAGPERTLAWRILDAQYFGVPQRRRRVFLVGCTGASGLHPGDLLFEPQSLYRDTQASRQKGQVAPTLPARSSGGGGLGTDFDCDGGLIPLTVGTIVGSAGRRGGIQEQDGGRGLIACFGGNNTTGPIDVATACNAHGGPCGRLDFESETFVVSEGKATHTLRAMGHDGSHANAGGQVAIAFDCKAGGNTGFSVSEKPSSLRGNGHGGGHAAVALPGLQWRVRRLMPLECERLQGFPDHHTRVPVTRGKTVKAAADGPRYKAIGNSMAVPCMLWIGERIRWPTP